MITLYDPKKCLLLVLLVLMMTMTGCRKTVVTAPADENDDGEEVVHTEMRYFDFDSVSDLPSFFDSISIVHDIPIRDMGDDEGKYLSDCIKRIEGYRKGRYKFYPDSLVKQCIAILGHECAFINNHGPNVDMTYAEWFLMLAAYYSPDITCLVNMQTPDHKAGVLNFGSTYNYSPWWSYLFLKRENGFEVRRIREDSVRIERIFQIEDDNGRLYYLCSNNMDMLVFLQVLYWVREEGDVMLVAECDSLPARPDADFETLYYNPDLHVWYCCNLDEHTEKLIPVSDKPAMSLELDGANSRFKAPM